MKLKLMCISCSMDMVPQAGSTHPYNEAGVYRFTCERGHEQVVILQQERFEVLAEVAIQAAVDGYFRETVSSFAASLERFYEFYIQTIWISLNVEREARAVAWKAVAASSERQFGLFVGLFSTQAEWSPTLLPHAEFRNRVVHKGYLPSEQEAIAYGQDVIDFIRLVYAALQRMHPGPTRQAHLETLVSAASAAQPFVTSSSDRGVVTHSYPSIYQLQPQRLLEDEILRRRHR